MGSVLSRGREIINAEALALANIPLDNQFEQAVDLVYNCKGKVITTGIGKAGHVAQKIAGTLCSTGTPAVFLHPADAAHGD
ncbi:MAG: hypothetical protein PHC61_04545, partial [Chitinivibrionales bacterium]|nr:hypothetical protein [Chitinivibrionales bacterium]